MATGQWAGNWSIRIIYFRDIYAIDLGSEWMITLNDKQWLIWADW